MPRRKAVLAAQATARGRVIADVAKGLPSHAASLGAALAAVARRLTQCTLVREALARVGALPAKVRRSDGGEARETLVEREVEQEVEQEREAYAARTPARQGDFWIEDIYRSDWLAPASNEMCQALRLAELPGGDLFDDRIHVTPDLLVSVQGEDVAPFNLYQKPACFALAIQRRNTPALEVLLLSHHAAEQVDRRLREADPIRGDLNLMLLDENGLVLRSGRAPIRREDLAGPELDRLLMQAKVLSKPVAGELQLNAQQREQLRRWLGEGSEVEQARKHAIVARGRL